MAWTTFKPLNFQHMNYDDLVPLYKILCLALIFLVPLAPAWGLYKIAPADKFLAKGTFSGFRINATGAAAIYIVLFSTIVFQTSSIMKNIDSTESLLQQVKALKNQRPWTIKYKLKLMTADSTREIDPLLYGNIVKENSIACMPAALHVADDKKTLTFYMDNADIVGMGDPIETQVMINGYETRMIPVSMKTGNVDTANRIISVYPVIRLGSAEKGGLHGTLGGPVAVLGPNAGTVNPAPPPNVHADTSKP
jgi:hypothetical protein